MSLKSAQISFLDEITVDGFCGGGGWSTGFELALGRPVDIGINHDAAAIALHKANHPFTKHYQTSIFEVDPKEACAGRKVGWAHFSPDCKHFSRAKGAKPVNRQIRSLAWVVIQWAAAVRPRIISMENVPEFMTWGPCIAQRGRHGRVLRTDGTEALPGESTSKQNRQLVPDQKRKGQTFRQFVEHLQRLGYTVEWRELTASDYGAPTSRRRFFLLARCDGKPIVWPKPTHGDPKSLAVQSGQLQPWRTAAEIIDWTIPCPSIFERSKPLAENTMRRIARGLQKYVLDNPEPFIVQVNHSGDNFRGQSLDEPMPTVTSKHGFGVVTPYIMCNNAANVGRGMDDPVPTITTGTRNFLAAPTLIQYHTEQSAKEHRGQDVEIPLQTVDAANRYGLATAFISKYFGDGQQGTGSRMDAPLGTVTCRDRFGLVTVQGVNYQIVDIGLRMLTPRELYNAQGFPPDYEIETDCNGNAYPKKEQVARCGNAVPPAFATALARANYPEYCLKTPAQTMRELNEEWAV